MSTFLILKNAVDGWLSRDDVAVTNADFSTIMLLAESDIARDVHAIIQEASSTLVFTGREQDMPANFLEVRNPFIDDNIRRIEYMTPQALRESSAWQSGRRVGAFYTLEGNPTVPGDERVKMVIAGPASVTTPLSIDVNYYARFAGLVLDADTNWLLANHFDIYLYSALRAACEYIQEDILEDRYAGKYDRAVEKQHKHENRKRFAAFPKQQYGSPRSII